PQSRRFAESQGRAGLLEYLIPSYADGPEARVDVRSICIIRDAITYRSALADSALIVQGIVGAPICRSGSDRLRRLYLDDIRGGRIVPAFALSEPGGGSDVAATLTTATRDGNDYILNGTKTWTSNAGVA